MNVPRHDFSGPAVRIYGPCHISTIPTRQHLTLIYALHIKQNKRKHTYIHTHTHTHPYLARLIVSSFPQLATLDHRKHSRAHEQNLRRSVINKLVLP
jgi:hypothetical protein